MVLLLTIFVILLFILILKYVLPILKRHSQLRKDYQNISFLPLSSIPFVGNLHKLDKQPYDFFQLLCRISKLCQEQDKGIFCIWYSLWPVTVICTAKGLEVCIHFTFLSQTILSFNGIRHLLIIVNNWLNPLIINFWDLG
jgi:hypothetical protein